MSREVSVESSGETVGEAKWKALRDLERIAPGIDRGTVQYQVVSEGERGLLGVGFSPARVVAFATAPDLSPEEPRRHDESELATHVRALVERVTAALGVATRVEVHESAAEVQLTCLGGDLGLLIGKHGQTIDALQHVVNAVVHRLGETRSVTIDAAGYRERRRAALEGMALRAAERAARGERVALEPMTAVERKLVHERLKDVAGVATESEGTEPHRYVVVLPA